MGCLDIFNNALKKYVSKKDYLYDELKKTVIEGSYLNGYPEIFLMNVRIASEKDREKWNQFVDREGGSFFQYFDWKYIYEFNTSKHRFIPLVIENTSSEMLGIFPIEENLHLFYGSLSSLPFGASGGFLIKNDLTEQEKETVIQSFLEFIDANYSGSHSYIILREHLSFSEKNLTPSRLLTEYGYSWEDNTATGLPCTHVLKLESPFEEKIWEGLWSKKLRKRIRHTKKTGAEVIIDEKFAYIDDFYAMQIETVKKFGFVEQKEILEQIIRIFRDKIKVFVCLRDKKPISVALCYYTATTAFLAMAPYHPESEDYLTNTLPICASIRSACDKGYHYYEMGFTTTADLAFHKEKFGGKPIPLMIYRKKFSLAKMLTNLAFSAVKGVGRKYIRTR